MLAATHTEHTQHTHTEHIIVVRNERKAAKHILWTTRRTVGSRTRTVPPSTQHTARRRHKRSHSPRARTYWRCISYPIRTNTLSFAPPHTAKTHVSPRRGTPTIRNLLQIRKFHISVYMKNLRHQQKCFQLYSYRQRDRWYIYMYPFIDCR